MWGWTQPLPSLAKSNCGWGVNSRSCTLKLDSTTSKSRRNRSAEAEQFAAPDRGRLLVSPSVAVLPRPRRLSWVDYEVVGVSSEFTAFFSSFLPREQREASRGSRGWQ